MYISCSFTKCTNNKNSATTKPGKIVLLSIGGGTETIDLTTTANKNAFINSITDLVNTYGFDRIDIDIEHGMQQMISLLLSLTFQVNRF
ncbi:MAG: hypothetical protein HWD62_18500 [Cyclobacteriaceae bacterium]|nr:MAG: hypothetical protein HWD62_18500 [Cyclobacteriaceae bacterium]